MTTLIIDEISCLAHNSHCEVYQNDFLDRDPISQKKRKISPYVTCMITATRERCCIPRATVQSMGGLNIVESL